MYQPDFPPVPFRSGLYPVVDSVQWIERLLDAGVRTLQLRIKDQRDEEVEADVVAAIALVHRKTLNPKFINPGDQVKVDAKQGRMRMVKMEAVVQQPSETAEAADAAEAEKGEGKA